MLARSLQIAFLLVLSYFALAQQKSRQPVTSAAPASSTDCAASFTSGSGHNATSYCVTVNGNITQFSRADDEYIRVGDFTEGYGICDQNSNVQYFDYASAETGNWQASSFSSTATKAISTRVTSDNVWQITNTITKVAANNAGPGAAKVTMQIRNLTGVSRDLILVRFADVDFSQNGNDDFNNDFDFTVDTAFGLEPGFKSGLSLTTNSFNFERAAFTQAGTAVPNPCNPIPNTPSQPFFGDGAIGQAYLARVPKGGTTTITVTYKPI